MPQAVVNGLDLERREALLVAYSPSLRCWVASAGDLNAKEQRQLERGDTPAEALGLLFIALGANLVGTS